MSLQRYKATQTATETPRQTEYRLFGQVTRALVAARDAGDTARGTPDWHKALLWNRRLWLALQGDLAADGNGLPDELKARLISVAIWVDKHSRKVMKGEGEINPLIEVNRQVMGGLAS
jgi:flagellar biosynthesis activator protein FlaF